MGFKIVYIADKGWFIAGTMARLRGAPAPPNRTGLGVAMPENAKRVVGIGKRIELRKL